MSDKSNGISNNYLLISISKFPSSLCLWTWKYVIRRLGEFSIQKSYLNKWERELKLNQPKMSSIYIYNNTSEPYLLYSGNHNSALKCHLLYCYLFNLKQFIKVLCNGTFQPLFESLLPIFNSQTTFKLWKEKIKDKWANGWFK